MANGETGTDVIRVLEDAGERYLASVSPDAHCLFLMHVGGARLFEARDSGAFWGGIQAILDGFFAAPERAEICGRLLERSDLQRRAECRTFVANALAERRLQVMMAAARITPPTVAR